jgi:hypothetical protein
MTAQNWISIVAIIFQVIIASYIAFTVQKFNVKMNRVVDLEKSHRNEERNAIIEFHSKFSVWLQALMEATITGFDKERVMQVRLKQQEYNKNYSECSLSLSKIKLLVKSDKIIILSEEMFNDTLALKSWIETTLHVFHHNLESRDSLNEERKNLGSDPIYQDIRNDNLEELQKVAATLKDININFELDKWKNQQDILLINNKFTKEVKEYLTQ